MNNKRAGTRFEHEVAQRLREMGWWVHLLTQSAEGQPADIIAVRNGRAVLIDCKVCQNNWFKLDRIEPNQESAYRMWKKALNYDYLLVLKLKDIAVRALPLGSVLAAKESVSGLSKDVVLQGGIELERAMDNVIWRNRC